MKEYKVDGWVLKFTGPQSRHAGRFLDGVHVDVLPIGWQHGVKQGRLDLHLRSSEEAAVLFTSKPFPIALAIAKNREVVPHTVKSFAGVFMVTPLVDEEPGFDERNGQFKIVVKLSDRLRPPAT